MENDLGGTTAPEPANTQQRDHRGPCGACGGLVYIDQKRQKSKKTGKYFHGAGAGCRAGEIKDQSQEELDKPTIPAAPKEPWSADLYDAAAAGDLEGVASLIQTGARAGPVMEFDDARPHGHPHIVAAEKGYAAIVSVLMADAGAGVIDRSVAVISDHIRLGQGDRKTLRFENRWTVVDAMTAAAKGGHLDVVKVLLQQPADFFTQRFNISMISKIHGWHNTSPKGTIDNVTVNVRGLDLLLNDIVGACMHCVPPLMHAAAQGHLGVFSALIEAGARVIQQTRYIFKDDADREEYPRALDWRPIDALSAAVNGGHLNVVTAILELQGLDDNVGVSVVVETDYSETPKRTIYTQMKCRAVLFREVAGHCKNDTTPLMRAAAQGHFAIAKLLIDKGADVNATRGASLVTALKMAAASNSPNIMALLLQHGARIEPCLTPERFKDTSGAKSTLRIAAEWGNAAIVETLLRLGAALGGTGGTQHGTALMAAAKYGHLAVVKVLITAAQARGADYLAARLEDCPAESGSSFQGLSPLLIAAEHGHFEICKLLIQRGAAVRKNTVHTGYNNVGTTSALIRSIEGFSAYRPRSPSLGVPDAVGFTQTLNRDIKLVEAGNRNADRACEPPMGNYADKEAGLTQTIQMLCDHDSGAVIEYTDEFAMSPLILAVKLGRRDIVEMLLNPLRDDPNRLKQYLQICFTGAGHFSSCGEGECDCSADEGSGTALGFAASNDNLEMVKFLLELGASDNLPITEDGGTTGRSALVRAAASGNIEIAQLLLDQGASIESACYREKCTPLYIVAEKGDVAMIELLLDYGADIQYRIDKEGYTHHECTPLLAAARSDNTSAVMTNRAVQLLLASGAERNTTVKRGHHGDGADEMCTARDFVEDSMKQKRYYRDDKDGEEKKREAAEYEMLSRFMDRIYSIADDEYSPVRVAIELRLYQVVKSNLRHFRQAFMKNDSRGKGLVHAATTVESWPGAKPVCPITVRVAKAVEQVALGGWHRDSLWRRTTHWLQSDYVQAVAYELMLCANRLRCQQQQQAASSKVAEMEDASLPLLPVELWQIFLVFSMPCDAPATYPKPRKVHRTVVAERRAPKQKQGGCVIC